MNDDDKKIAMFVDYTCEDCSATCLCDVYY